MFSGLLASARELRNPLTIGFSVLVAIWLVAGEVVTKAIHADPLGRRLLAALDSLGDAAELALYTFIAAMVGSLFWNSGVSRFVRFLSVQAGHPDWNGLIEEAQEAVRRYEEYEVTTYKGASAGKGSPFDVRHSVPSPRQAALLQERVEERERKAAEMSFRVTLAVALVPIVVGLGVEGGGLWWWSIGSIPVVWFDVALLKYTTLRTVRRYELEDVLSRLDAAERSLELAKERGAQPVAAASAEAEAEGRRQEGTSRLQERIASLKAAEERLRFEDSRALSRMFAFLEGRPRA